MEKLIDDISIYLLIFLNFINVLLYVESYKKSNNFIALKYFTTYLFISLVINALSVFMATDGTTNLYLSHYYFVLQFILLSLFYKRLFSKSQKKAVNIVLIVILFAIGIQYSLNPSLYFKFNKLEIFLTSFPLVVYSMMHLYNSLNKKGVFMYINAGVLIYLTTSTLIFILGDYLSGILDNKTVSKIWTLNRILYILYLVLILIEWKKLNLQVKSKL